MRFGDTDMMGHVNNASYSTYLEDARIALFATAAHAGQAALILARTELDFVRPAQFGLGPVRTSVWVEHVGTKSFRLGYVLEQAGRSSRARRPCSSATTTRPTGRAS